MLPVSFELVLTFNIPGDFKVARPVHVVKYEHGSTDGSISGTNTAAVIEKTLKKPIATTDQDVLTVKGALYVRATKIKVSSAKEDFVTDVTVNVEYWPDHVSLADLKVVL